MTMMAVLTRLPAWVSGRRNSTVLKIDIGTGGFLFDFIDLFLARACLALRTLGWLKAATSLPASMRCWVTCERLFLIEPGCCVELSARNSMYPQIVWYEGVRGLMSMYLANRYHRPAAERRFCSVAAALAWGCRAAARR